MRLCEFHSKHRSSMTQKKTVHVEDCVLESRDTGTQRNEGHATENEFIHPKVFGRLAANGSNLEKVGKLC